MTAPTAQATELYGDPHVDGLYLRNLRRLLEQGVVTDERKQQIDRKLHEYHVFTKAWLSRNGRRS